MLSEQLPSGAVSNVTSICHVQFLLQASPQMEICTYGFFVVVYSLLCMKAKKCALFVKGKENLVCGSSDVLWERVSRYSKQFIKKNFSFVKVELILNSGYVLRVGDGGCSYQKYTCPLTLVENVTQTKALQGAPYRIGLWGQELYVPLCLYRAKHKRSPVLIRAYKCSHKVNLK